MHELLSGVESIPVRIQQPLNLKNKYFGLRHGESEANVEGVISSDGEVGSTIHGLTPKVAILMIILLVSR